MTIISASRRTDMPAFFPEKIMESVRSHLTLDGLVLWTKNPEPLFPYIKELQEKEIPFYFQYSLNDYGGLEPGIPDIKHRIITFRDLAAMVGRERVIWRFDPILLSDTISVDDVENRIEWIGNELHMYTEKLVFSFVDMYWKIQKERIRPPNQDEMIRLEKKILALTTGWGIKCATCAEAFQIPGIEHNQCIDIELLNRIGGNHLMYKKDSSQRELCGCAKSIDIGEYHSCKHGCTYCYARGTA